MSEAARPTDEMPPAATLTTREGPSAMPSPPSQATGAAPATKGLSTYGQILRSSAIIGGSSALNLAINIVRTKAMAVMLGPAGFGLMGAFTTIADLARTLAEMGINNSGVRQIAESAGSGDSQRIARTVTVLRRTTVVLGLLGALLLAAFSRQVATLTFGSDEHWGAVALLSLAVFFRLVSDGQGALLQGMRRIGDIARLGVFGALLGAIISVAIVYGLREEGVALSLLAIAAMSWVFSSGTAARSRSSGPPWAYCRCGAKRLRCCNWAWPSWPAAC